MLQLPGNSAKVDPPRIAFSIVEGPDIDPALACPSADILYVGSRFIEVLMALKYLHSISGTEFVVQPEASPAVWFRITRALKWILHRCPILVHRKIERRRMIVGHGGGPHF